LYFVPNIPDEELSQNIQEISSLSSQTSEGKKKEKVEPIKTIVRNKATGECVDEDGIPVSMETFSREEWEVVSKSDSEENLTTYKLKYVGKKLGGSTPTSKSRKKR
jgi:hypothetical protein